MKNNNTNKFNFLTHLLLFSLFLGFSVTVVGQQSPGEAKPPKQIYAKSVLGEKSPEIFVENWISDQPDSKNKFVLVDFWATWCGPCRKAIPELNHWAEKYKENLVVIGLSDESVEKIQSMKQPVMNYFSASDTQKRTKSELQVRGIPHVILIDPQGIVRWEGFPFLPGYELTDQVLEEIFATYGKGKKK